MKRTAIHLVAKLSLLLIYSVIGWTQSSGLFTEAQAQRGQSLYAAKCASCHGASLEGGSASALSGSKFAAKWTGKSVDDLYFITRTQMPYGAGGTLSNKEYLDIVVYLLKGNGYTTGTRELTADAATLKSLKIQPQGSIKDRVMDTPTITQPTSTVVQPTAKFPTQEELNAAQSNSNDWLMSNHDYSGQRFVDLKQITPANAATLRPACMYQASDTKAFHNNPVVYRGVIYITTSTSTIALDAANCRQKWRHDWKPKSIEIHPPNRGVAIKDGRVVRATTDGFLFALDIESGKVLWERQVVNSAKNEGSFNMAPVIFEDTIILGLGISEQGVKGWIGGFKLADGSDVWRFNTVPDDGEPGAETWGTGNARKMGGGAVWSPPSLDPQTGVIYVPVANPAADFYGANRPGANLYTGSMIVLNARTGKLQWYFQAVPHDTHDWDLTQTSPLFTTTINGKQRKLIAVVGKDGLMHVLDRETKEKVYDVPVTTRLNAEIETTTQAGPRTCPGVMGGVLWNGPAFNPRTNMLYVPAVDWCGVFTSAKELRQVPGQVQMGGFYRADPIDKARGWLTAVDAATGKVAWKYESPKPMLAAVTTTSTDVLFTGELTGDFLAMNARTGKLLYRFYTGGPMNGGVVSYAVNGKQYVAVASGSASGFWYVAPGSSTIVIFALPERTEVSNVRAK
ncbi:MAG: PQQ-binding-like beta-propeller repeat protein [Blastocatellia bacterium]|nr:PQQ-binding-like beta-propeller repeat protein [Blastocatellia bacterium]